MIKQLLIYISLPLKYFVIGLLRKYIIFFRILIKNIKRGETNERACDRAIKNSGVKREDIFLSTKLWPSEYENKNAVDETLERLDTDYIDLLYIHQPAGNWFAGYEQLEIAYKSKKVRSIGISNFEGKYIEELQKKIGNSVAIYTS